MKIDGNAIKIGNIIEHKNKLWKVIKTQHTQPGKGGAYLQVELKDLKNGTKLNERFRSSESVKKVRLEEKNANDVFNVNLDAGDIVVPTISHTDTSGTRTFVGSITLKFITR